MVHEHHARRLHWDLRLERDGVLASWAVPNGIPEDPKRNRKAIRVEDHPLEYLNFSGTVPAGSYGAGEVSIWDSGAYSCEKWRADEVIAQFHGRRMHGRYALFQAGHDRRDWMIHRMDPPLDPDAETMPRFIKPMLAKLTQLPSDQSRWAFEVKWDGVRAIARSQPGQISFLSRNGNEISDAYPELRGLGRALGSQAAILDGEIVALDEHGRPSFQTLQARMHVRQSAAIRRLREQVPVTYMIFDLLWLDGHALTDLPYDERRARLERMGLDDERWRVPEFHRGQGKQLLHATAENGLEGIMGKRLDSRYLPGSRSGAWVKIKNSQRQEAVIGGWTTGEGARAKQIGALDLGVHGEDGTLRYVGKVGTGFDARELSRLGQMLKPLARTGTPFSGRQPARGTHFVEPSLVCEVEFSEWTHAGTLRQPSYKGLRDDKPAAEVVRERAAEPDEAAAAGAAAPAAPTQPGGTHPDQRRKPVDTDAQPSQIESLIEAGRRVRNGVEIELQDRVLKLTNLDKVLYPKVGFTKRALIGFYAAVAPVLLEHLRDRPLTLKRYPDGVDGEFFYEKRSPPHRPDWVQTAQVRSERGSKPINYTLCQDLPTLVWLANLADIELHPLLARAADVRAPTVLAFDLDPGAPASIVECCEVALVLHELLGQLGLRSFAKTSGSKGLQVYVPLNHAKVTYEQTKPFALAVARLLEQRHPKLIVSDMAKARRRGRVLVDWSQNDEHKTTISVYSLRATPAPAVSTPLDWDEVRDTQAKRDPALLRFEPDQTLRRIAEHGDLFADVLTLKQAVPSLEG